MTATVEPKQAVAPIDARLEVVRPVLEQHVSWAEENRRVHPEVIDALHEAQFFNFRRAPQLGGTGETYREIAQVVGELSRVDASVGWTVAVNAITSWMASHLPDVVQQEVFAGPSQICGTLSPSGMLKASPTGDGFILDGAWKFISGAPTSGWQVVIAIAEPGRLADQPVPAYAVVPMDDLKVVDDWHTTGLRGTGSVSTVAEGVRVPAERVSLLPPLLAGAGSSAVLQNDPQFGSPLVPTAAALSSAVAPGVARAALAAFLERAKTRPITYTGYASQAEAAVTHLQAAEATHLVEESEFHVHSLAAQLDDFDPSRQEYWSELERVAARARLGRSTELALDAVRIVADASGGSSIYLDSPIQRQLRDLQAMAMHALIAPVTNGELFGRALLGLEPTTLYY